MNFDAITNPRPARTVTRKGTTYFPTSTAALDAARAHGWPIDRILGYRLGWAVQAYKGGPYLDITCHAGEVL